jgi:hypothetical protein
MNRKKLWADLFINVMKYIKSNKGKTGGNEKPGYGKKKD